MWERGAQVDSSLFIGRKRNSSLLSKLQVWFGCSRGRYVVVHKASSQTDTEGRMAKVLPDLVRRSNGAAEEGWAIPPVSVVEEWRTVLLGLADEGGRPRAYLAAGCGTGGSFLGRPRFEGWAGEASEGVYAGLSLKVLTISWRVPGCSLKDDR